MSKSRFRLIALSTFTPTNADDTILTKIHSMQKKTFNNGWMYFGKGYLLEDAPNYYNKENEQTPFRGYKLNVDDSPDYDMALYDIDDLCISVNAIVGANGSGKSSTVDMILRILNNFSVAAMGEIKNSPTSEHLYFIEDVYGCLVFKEGGYFYQINIEGRSVKIGRYESCSSDNCYICREPIELLSEKSKENKFDPIEKSGIALTQLSNMFYTAIFNYSLYAFNYNDYYEERTLENRWNKINRTNQGKYWNGKFSQNQVWLNGLFHKNDGYQTPIVLNPMRENGQINIVKENALSIERIVSKLLYVNKTKKGHGNQPAFPFRYINEHLEIVALKLESIKNPKFSRRNVLSELGYKNSTKIHQHFDSLRNDLTIIWSSLMQMPYTEETDDEKLAWDYVVYKTLKISKNYSHYNKITRIAVYNDSYDLELLKNELQKMLRDESHVTLKLRRALYFLKYDIYGERDGDLINLYSVYNKYKYWDDLYDFMKIRIINSRSFQIDLPEGWTEDDVFKLKVNADGHLSVNVPISKEKPLPLYFINEEEGMLTIKKPDAEEMILPPIYEIKMMVIEKDKINNDGSFDKNNLIPLDGLSSGEKQLIYSISNYIYHICNINSVGENKNKIVFNYKNVQTDTEIRYGLIQYKYINLILDEVELYFHPDLQRRYLKSLMEMLGNVPLNNIEGINILIITHSPFILSDIPDDNIMYLDNKGTCHGGKTFGGNIHEMLGDSFFMESNIGAFAEQKMSEFITLYYNKDKSAREKMFKQKYKSFECLKDIIADNYLKRELECMYLEMCNQYKK